MDIYEPLTTRAPPPLPLIPQVARRLAEVPFEEQADAWEAKMADKLLFLSDRLYAQLEEEETREYELGRVTEILGLSPKVCVWRG